MVKPRALRCFRVLRMVDVSVEETCRSWLVGCVWRIVWNVRVSRTAHELNWLFVQRGVLSLAFAE